MIYVRVIRLIFGQNIQCHLKLFKPLLQRTREQRQTKSTFSRVCFIGVKELDHLAVASWISVWLL